MAIKLAPDAFDFPEVAAPATPDTGYIRVYGKSDGKMYKKDDAGVETELGGGSNTTISADTLTLNDGSELTIASGAITVTHSRHIVDTEADASEDNLDTVNGLAEGEVCLISPANGSRHIVIRSAGNITIPGGANIRLSGVAHCVLLLGTASGATAFNLNLSKAVDLNDLYSLGASGGTTIIHNGTIFIPQVNRVTTINPTTGDDANDGYAIGSWWINISAPAVFFCTDPTVSSAVWIEVTGRTQTQTLTNKTIDADDNTLSNIGAAEVKADLISGQDEITSVDSANDRLLILDATDGLLKEVAPQYIASPYVADGIAFTDPTAQTWTNLNHGSGTYTEDATNKRLYMIEDGNGSAQLRGWYTSAPSAPYAIRMHCKYWGSGASNMLAVGFRQNSTSELHVIIFGQSTGTQFAVQKWNTATSVNSNYIAATTVIRMPHWYKIEDDNTNRIISISDDGVIWTPIHTIGRTDFLTADEIFFGMIVTTNATYDSHVSLLSYEEL